MVLIDCPPSLGALTRTALASAGEVLMPIQCEYFAMEGLAQMIEVIRQVIGRANSRLEFGGILLTMYDRRLNLANQVADEARRHFGAKVYGTVIPRNVKLSESPSFGKPILHYDAQSAGAETYMQLAREVIETGSLPTADRSVAPGQAGTRGPRPDVTR